MTVIVTRVVTLDNPSTDAVLALGIVPVAMAKLTYVPGGMQTWTKAALVGQALGREDEARKLVADTEARVAQAAKDHPAFQGKTVTLFNLFQGDAYAISGPSDFSIRFLSTLGFELTPTIARLNDSEQAGTAEARVQVSRERRELLDADVVIGTSSDSSAAMRSLTRERLFRRLSAVRRDAYATVDIGRATSIAFPSALSISYALDELVPRLDRLTR